MRCLSEHVASAERSASCPMPSSSRRRGRVSASEGPFALRTNASSDCALGIQVYILPLTPSRSSRVPHALLALANFLLASCWPLAGLLLASCWPLAGLLLPLAASCWPLACLLASCWLLGLLLASCWPLAGFLASFWPLPNLLLASSWPLAGLLLASGL